MKTKSILPLLAWCAALIPAAHAHQPQPFDVRISPRISASGRSALVVTNSTRQLVTVVLSPGNMSTVRFTPQEITIGPLGVTESVLDTPALADGIQALQVSSRITAIDLQPTSQPGPVLHQIVRVRAGSVEKMTYEEAYLAGRRAVEGESETVEIPIGDGAIERATMPRQSFSAQPVFSARVGTVNFPEPISLLGMMPRQVPSVGDASHIDSSSLLRGAASPERSLQPTDPNDPGPDDPSITMTVTGRWLLRLPTGFDSIYTHEPGWGWTVRAWQYDGAQWRYRGSSTIGATGDFKLVLSKAVVGQKLRLVFSPQNRFVSVIDPKGNPYNWSVQVPAPTAKLNVGTQMADLTAGGDAPGIYEIFSGANRLWNKFSSYGVNVLRDSAIQITYPNTLDTGSCQEKDASGEEYPWSCAYWGSGKIWIIAEHADTTVVMHEIAHSINAYFWDKLPEGAGGSHSANKCYTPGLALTEGFANFVAYWVKIDRANADPNITYLGAGLETVDSRVCTGDSNETRVAALLWDAHDTHYDAGDDGFYDDWFFTKPYAVPVIYLNNKSTSILDFRTTYKQILGSAWNIPVDNLFRLNRLYW